MPWFNQHSRTCSAPSPFQASLNNTLDYLHLVNELPPIQNLVRCNPVPFSTLRPAAQAVILLVLYNSMRCQELLNIKVKDEVKPSLFLVHGLKKSHSYTVHIPITGHNRKLLDSCLGDLNLFPFDYHFIWRSMCRAGLPLSISTRVNRMVTHRARYELASKLELLNERSNITSLLRHKSKKTKSYYLGVLPK